MHHIGSIKRPIKNLARHLSVRLVKLVPHTHTHLMIWIVTVVGCQNKIYVWVPLNSTSCFTFTVFWMWILPIPAFLPPPQIIRQSLGNTVCGSALPNVYLCPLSHSVWHCLVVWPGCIQHMASTFMERACMPRRPVPSNSAVPLFSSCLEMQEVINKVSSETQISAPILRGLWFGWSLMKLHLTSCYILCSV